MSRFFRPELSLALSGTTALLRHRKLWRVQLKESPLPADTRAENQLLAATSTLLTPYTAASLMLFLPSSQFIFWNVPWISDSLSEPQVHDVAESLLQQDFGMTADSILYTLSPARFGATRIACGLQRSIVDNIKAILPEGIHLTGIQPLLSLSWPSLIKRKHAMLYSEPGFAAILPVNQTIAIHTRRLPISHIMDQQAGEALAALVGVSHFQKLQVGTTSTLSTAPALRLDALMKVA